MRHWYGFGLSLLTAVMWGLLPIALSLLVEAMDVLTITWTRFVVAGLLVFLFLAGRRNLPPWRGLGLRRHGLALLASLALTGNFLLFLESLNYLAPESSQMIIQLAPFILMLGSVLLFKEPFGRFEWAGAALLFAGLLVFFNTRLGPMIGDLTGETIGALLMLGAALSWGLYGLLQKVLLRHLNSGQLTLLIYGEGAIVLTLFASLDAFTGLSPLQIAALAFACLNMVVAYGAFTEALHHWHAAKVSAVIALAPLFTLSSLHLCVLLWPDVFPDSQLNLLAYLGALMVVAGSMMASLGRAPVQRPAETP